MDRERVYLDTNVIAHRILREEEVVTRINSVIGEMSRYCSAFVVSEHKRTFLKTMRFLWTIFKDKRDNREVLDCIENVLWRSESEKDRCMRIFKWVTEDEALSYIYAIVRLENMIFGYDQFFFDDIDVLESEIDCPLSEARIHSRKDILEAELSCSMKCKMSDFLKNQKNNLVKVEENIRMMAHMGLLVAIMRRVIKNTEEYDEGICRNLADVIIILEAPDYCSVCSNNVKHFEPICRVLGKKFLPIRY